LAAAEHTVSGVPFKLSPLVDDSLPVFPKNAERKDYPVEGSDGRLKVRTELWLGSVVIYVREYHQELYGDPA
jgi:hypothetical protein